MADQSDLVLQTFSICLRSGLKALQHLRIEEEMFASLAIYHAPFRVRWLSLFDKEGVLRNYGLYNLHSYAQGLR